MVDLTLVLSRVIVSKRFSDQSIITHSSLFESAYPNALAGTTRSTVGAC